MIPHSYKTYYAIILLLVLSHSLGSLKAQSQAVEDNYTISEDSELKTGTGPILQVSFDEERAPGVIDENWQILDRIENENGDSEDYPTDDSGNTWTESDFDINSSNVGPWFVAPVPIQTGGINAFQGLDDELFGIDEAANGENLITTYLFRNKFSVDEKQAQTSDWEISYLADDGIIVYVNQIEVFRSPAIPEGLITTLTPAIAGVNDEDNYLTARVDLEGLLSVGENQIAVELHQAGNTSSDVGFDLNMSPLSNSDSGSNTFSYVDDPFDGPFATSSPNNANGSIQQSVGIDGTNAAYIQVGGGWFFGPVTSSGSWRNNFRLEESSELEISFRYRLVVSENYEENEYGAVIFAIDGNYIGDNGNEVDRLTGEGQSDTGWQTFTTQISLDAGNHTLDLGVYNNRANAGNELTDVWFDDIVINYSGVGSRSGVLENDSIENIPSVAEVESNPSHGTLSMNDDGTFVYIPEIDFFGEDEFSYKITNANGSSNAAKVTITVESVNDLPVVLDRSFTITEDEVLSVNSESTEKFSATDIENQPLVFAVGAQSENGRVVIEADGSFNFTPNDNFSGLTSFTYVASDGEGQSFPGKVEVDVLPVNDTPSANDDNFVLTENNTLQVSPGVNAFPKLILEEAFDGGVDFAFSGNVEIESVEGFSSLRGFDNRFLRNSTSGNPADSTTIIVENLPPHDKISLGFVLAIIDSWDGEFFTVTVDGESVFSHSFSNRPGFNNQSYEASEETLLARSQDLGFTSGPLSLDSAYDLRNELSLKEIPHNSDSITIELVASGDGWQGGDNQSWAIDNFELRTLKGSNVELISSGSTWLFLDDGSNPGNDWIDLDFDDEFWSVGDGKFGYGDDNETTLISFGDDDADKHPTTFFRHWFDVDEIDRVESLELGLLRDDGAAVYINGEEVVRSNLAPDSGFEDFSTDVVGGDDELTYFSFDVDPSVLRDGDNLIAVEVHQTSATSSDLGFDLSLTARLSSPTSILSNDVDVDGDELNVALVTPPENGVLEFNEDGSFTYNPGLNYEGQDSFEYSISDGEFTDTAKVTIDIEPSQNDLPVSSGEIFQVSEDTTLQVDASDGVLENDYDPDGVDIVAFLKTDPQNGSLSFSNDGSFVYVPNKDFYGQDKFVYQVADLIGKAPAVTATINVTPSNDEPVANDDLYLGPPNRDLIISIDSLISNDDDPDGDELIVNLLNDPEVGTFTNDEEGKFKYTPNPDFSGVVEFEYFVSDGELNSEPAKVSIRINEAPKGTVKRYVVNEDSVLNKSAKFGLLSKSTDSENDNLATVLVKEPVNGSLSVSSDGSFSYTPDADFSGLDTFEFAVNDGYQNSQSIQTLIYVIDVDDAPVSEDDEYFVLVGQSISVSPENGLLKNDTDVEGHSAEVSLLEYLGDGELNLRSDGSFDYKPAENFYGKESFKYRSIANGQLSNISIVELEVGGPDNTIVISEVMFNSTSGDPGEEFIELHNIGLGPVSMKGWTFSSGVNFDFPDVDILPGEFFVIAADLEKFVSKYGEVDNLIGPWTGQLSNRGERIRIKDSYGETVDDITYSDQGDWATRIEETDQNILRNETGWKWTSLADGGGASLQLINNTISNRHGQNWSVDKSPTPGNDNENSTEGFAPLILNVSHNPPVPNSEQPVLITARLKSLDESSNVAHLFWRVSAINGSPFNKAQMFDNATGGDVEANDNIFSAVIPPQEDGTVIEFYIISGDEGVTRTWPNFGNIDNAPAALFQFDNNVYSGNQPVYRLIMSVREDRDFRFRNFNSSSDAQKNATFIVKQGEDYDVRYQCGVRVRGAGSRTRNPRNNRLNIPRDNPWNGITKINLNSQYIYLQLLGSRLASLSGIEAADARPIQLRYNGVNRANDDDINRRYGSFLHIEAIDADWADNHFPDDSGGNIYSKGRPDVKWDIRSNQSLGPDPDRYRDDGWSKSSNESVDDWTDLHRFMRVINSNSDDNYLETVGQVVDVDQWARWFAFMTIVLSRETNLSNGTDDDYKFYGGLKDSRFKIIPHDFDTIFGLGDTDADPDDSIFPAITNFAGQRMPQLDNFFNNPTILTLYYENLRDLLGTVFSKERFDAFVINSLDWLPEESDVVEDVISFMDERRAFINRQISNEFSVESNLSDSNGFARTTDPGLTGLEGTFDPIITSSIKINGLSVPINRREGTWDGDQPESDLIFSLGSDWKYLDNGTDQGIEWRDQDFDDSQWAEGPSEFGYGDRGEVTTVSYGDDPDNKFITTYFRKKFTINNVNDYANLRLRLVYDDGAAVYLNGTEVLRENLDEAANYLSLATDTIRNANAQSFNISSEALKDGDNTIAVEIHQRSPSSRDISFDAELLGLGAVPLMNPGINQVNIEAINFDGEVISSELVPIWYDDDRINAVQPLEDSARWTLEGGPYLIDGNFEVPVDKQLVIDPGVTVYFTDGSRMTVKGHLIAEGTNVNPITFTSSPDSSSGWDGIYFEDSPKDNKIIHLVQDNADEADQSINVLNSKLLLQKVSWTRTTNTILELNKPRVDVVKCDFPSTSGEEVIHGENLDGEDYFNLIGNVFRSSSGYNDVIDFSGGRRPGPIIYVLDNTFLGSTDDCLDLDGIDAHIEGNQFFNVHTDDPDRESSSSAIATDNNAHLTIVRNLFYDVDHALLLKNNSDAIFENNTVVRVSIASISFDEPSRSGVVPGRMISMNSNIFDLNAPLFAHQFSTEEDEKDPEIIANNNILPEEHLSLGDNNINDVPLFEDESSLAFALSPGSPAIGKGNFKQDMGWNIPQGAIISGEPSTVTRSKEARLNVHISGISGIENDSEFITEYQWRLDGQEWSDPVSIGTPIELKELAEGVHYVEVIGKDSAGRWQEKPTMSETWTVDSDASGLVINEILADNLSYEHEGSYPDFIELWNDSDSSRDISGMVISQSSNINSGWQFPEQTIIEANGYVVVYANDVDGTSGFHSGFGLDKNGESVYLFDTINSGGELIDSIDFGNQLTDRSVGRTGRNNEFSLMLPTPGVKNGSKLPLASENNILINEWLSSRGIIFDNDFLELYNPGQYPVHIGGMFLSDDPNNDPSKYTIPQLSYIDQKGFIKFIADNDFNQGPPHLNFSLSKLQDQIAVFDQNSIEVDRVGYANSLDNVSQGRVSDGSLILGSFSLPTPGYSNEANLDEELNIINSLRVTEIMYNPSVGTEAEFIKLENIGQATIQLSNVRFVEGINFDFPESSLAPGQSAYVVRDIQTFKLSNSEGLVLGEYRGKLDNGGERVRLEIASISAGILDFEYDDDWFPETDGGGSLLKIIDSSSSVMSWSKKDNWEPFAQEEENPYKKWVVQYFGEEIEGKTGPANDPDNDGVSNLLEFALGLNPILKQSGSFLPQVLRDETGLSLTYNSIKSLEDYIVKVQVSTDLSNWTDVSNEDNYEVVFEDELIKTVSVRLEFEKDLNNSSVAFMRLVVEGK